MKKIKKIIVLMTLVLIVFHDGAVFALERDYHYLQVLLLRDHSFNSEESSYLEERVQTAVENYHGEILGKPLYIRGDFENAGLPEVGVVKLETGTLMILKFEDIKYLKKFSSDDIWNQVDEYLKTQNIYLTHLGLPPGNFPFPVFNTGANRSEPAFILVNFAKNTIDGPSTRYQELAFPMAMAAGTRFYKPFVVLENFRDQFDFHLLLFTEWKSFEVFESFHKDPNWLEIVPLRNERLLKFTESFGIF